MGQQRRCRWQHRRRAKPSNTTYQYNSCKQAPTKGNVIGFFLQVIATKIISFELVNKDTLQCVVTKQTTGTYVYKDTYSWLGIEFRSPRRGNAAISLFDIIQAQEKAKELLREY